MPRNNSLENYGPEYEQLLLRASNGLSQKSSEFVVQFERPDIATSIRARTYGYFKALRTSNLRPDLSALATNISMRIAGSALVFFRRENSEDVVAIRNALGLDAGFAEHGGIAGVVAPTSGQTDALDRLRAIRNRNT